MQEDIIFEISGVEDGDCDVVIINPDWGVIESKIMEGSPRVSLELSRGESLSLQFSVSVGLILESEQTIFPLVLLGKELEEIAGYFRLLYEGKEDELFKAAWPDACI